MNPLKIEGITPAKSPPGTSVFPFGPLTIEVTGVPHTDHGDRWTIEMPLAKRTAAIAACAAVQAGVSNGRVFRALRKALSMQSAEMETLLDCRPETISAWETEKAPVDRAALVSLAVLVRERYGVVLDGILFKGQSETGVTLQIEYRPEKSSV